MNFKEASSLLSKYGRFFLYKGEHLIHADLLMEQRSIGFFEGGEVIGLELFKVILPGTEVEKYIDIHKSRNIYVKTLEGGKIPVIVQNMNLNMPVIDVTAIESIGSFIMPTQGELRISISVFEHGFDDAFASLNKPKPIVIIEDPIESRFDILDL